ncbi:hypothetical protein KKD03_03620 [Patescibacteria group bacterium]|nr:hypothetical protein [Patescibacteria group bacterium]
MKSRIVMPVIAIGIIAIAITNSVSFASARDSELTRETLVSRLASRFGLNEVEVSDTFEEFKLERGKAHQEKMQERMQQRLDNEVQNGSLTQDQEFAILAKHEELEGKYDDLYNLSPEDRREVRADIHEEMMAWAEANGISMDEFERADRGFNGEFGGEFRGQGKGFMHIEN